MNEQDHARCFTPENVAKKRPRTSSTLQTPCRSTKSTPLWEKVLNSDFEMTNMQLKFIIFVGAYIVSTLLFSDVQRCWFIHLFYSLVRLKFVTVMSRVINKRPTKSIGLSSSEHCEYIQTLFQSSLTAQTAFFLLYLGGKKGLVNWSVPVCDALPEKSQRANHWLLTPL